LVVSLKEFCNRELEKYEKGNGLHSKPTLAVLRLRVIRLDYCSEKYGKII